VETVREKNRKNALQKKADNQRQCDNDHREGNVQRRRKTAHRVQKKEIGKVTHVVKNNMGAKTKTTPGVL